MTMGTDFTLFKAPKALASLIAFSVIISSEYLSSLTNINALSNTPVWLSAGFAISMCFIFGRHVTPIIFVAASIGTFISFTDVSLANALVYSVFYSLCLTIQSLCIYQLYKHYEAKDNPLINSNNLMVYVSLCFVCSLVTSVLINIIYCTFIVKTQPQFTQILSLLFSDLLSLLIIPALFFAVQNLTLSATKFKFPTEYFTWLASCLLIAATANLLNQSFFLFSIPLLMWSSIRLRQPACSSSLLITTLFIIHELIIPPSSFQAVLPQFSLHLAWLVLILTTLYLNTLRLDHQKIASNLEKMVIKRTQQFQTANLELKDEIYIREQAEQSFRTSSKRYKALFETAGIPIIVLNQNFCIKQWNMAAELLFGYVRDEIVGKNYIDMFIPENMQDETAWKFTKVIKSGISKESLESKIISYDGLSHTMLWNISHLSDLDEDPRLGQLLLIGQNISEIRKTQNQLHYLAHFDALTDTANRRLFEDRCKQSIQSAIRHKHSIALIGLDIDHFKRINDSLGHDAGDQFLVTLAERLKQCIRKEDTVARLGGDEFAILLSNISGQDGAEKAARNILEVITQPVNIKGNDLIITSSIGITLCPSDGSEYPELLKNSDMAMYRAKNAGRNNIQFYSPEMNDEMTRQLNIEQELRAALKENQFRLYYQPIVDIETGEVLALEALLRWIHPKKGIVRPDYFLQTAEQTGQLHEIGMWALKNACLQGRAIQEWSAKPMQIALNLSNRQFNHPNLVELVESIIKETQFNPHNLILEMSENTITTNIDASFVTLSKLKSLGVSLTLDSFGTGLSSLRQLKKIPIDIIKIDQTFVSGIPNDESDMAITETLLAICDQMNLKSFATGVETQEQEAFLKINGCGYAQGYLYAKPAPFSQLPDLFKKINSGHNLSEGEQIFLPFEHKNRTE
ncbi:MAG: diguanylate cyclase (GGDEF)-like protein/PAS domain S-box-containing protein [Oleiphilaceae bacterium]|jgi:diguanylate cyclase (GGDEF)-like protein/PAS domain S-box-containing protein